MLACLQGLDRDLGVPVVWRNDTDHFDLFVIEHAAVIFYRFRFAFADPLVVPSPFSVIGVDIANRDDVSEPIMIVRVSGTHTTEPDAADLESIRS